MCGLLGLILLLGTSMAAKPYDSTNQLSEFNVIENLAELSAGLLDEGLRAAAYAEQFLDNVNSAAFKKIVTLYKENGRLLMESCKESMAADLATASACFNITGDVANITQIAINTTYVLSTSFKEMVFDLKEMNDCQTEPFWKIVPCYKKAFGDCQGLIKKYSVRFDELLTNTTLVLQQLKVDVHDCFAHSDTARFSERFEKNIALCKLKLI